VRSGQEHGGCRGWVQKLGCWVVTRQGLFGPFMGLTTRCARADLRSSKFVPDEFVFGPSVGVTTRCARADLRSSKFVPDEFVDPGWALPQQSPPPEKQTPPVGASVFLAERVGFEPTVGFHLRLISSQVHSTTLPPLRNRGLAVPSRQVYAARHGETSPRGLHRARWLPVRLPSSWQGAARCRPRYPGSGTAIRCLAP